MSINILVLPKNRESLQLMLYAIFGAIAICNGNYKNDNPIYISCTKIRLEVIIFYIIFKSIYTYY